MPQQDMFTAPGGLTIHRIVELTAPTLPLTQLLPGLTEAQIAESADLLGTGAVSEDGRAIMEFQSFVVRTPHHTILIDSCIGNDKTLPHAADWHRRQGNTYEHTLAQAGLRFADIDYVFCTHLHADHVGWNTRLVDGRWQPSFPNARYVFSAAEVAYWQEDHARSGAATFAESIQPVLEANRADLVADDAAIGDHIRLLPTPGHTPHHVAILLGKSRDDAAFAGDILHTPLQFRFPDLHAATDRLDPGAAAASRRAFLERYAGTDTVCCFIHTPAPSAGRIRAARTGFTCVPV